MKNGRYHNKVSIWKKITKLLAIYFLNDLKCMQKNYFVNIKRRGGSSQDFTISSRSEPNAFFLNRAQAEPICLQKSILFYNNFP